MIVSRKPTKKYGRSINLTKTNPMANEKKAPNPKVTPEQLMALVERMQELKSENETLKAQLNKTRLPDKMLPDEYNWCIERLRAIRLTFNNLEEAPEMVEIPKSPIILP